MEKFRIVRDQTGYETKLLNFDNPDVCPRSGIIELEAIFAGEKKIVSISLTSFMHDGIFYGIDQGRDPKTGVVNFRRIELSEYRMYNLSDVNDAKEWAVVRMAHFLENSPRRKGKPLFRVKDHELIAKKKLSGFNAAKKAMEIAENLTGDEMREFARLLNINIINNSYAIIQGNLCEKAQRDSEYFMSKWDDVNRPILTILRRCIETSVITTDPLAGYKVNKSGLFLGDQEASTIAYLHKNHNILISIDEESKRIERGIEDTKKEDLMPKSEKDEEIEALKKQLEELKSKVNKPAPEEKTAGKPEKSPERLKLEKVAKQYKIQNYWVKSDEKLQLEIDIVEETARQEV